MRLYQFTVVSIFCVSALVAQDGIAKEGSVFDASEIDTKGDPCVDFYQYACGTWLAKNPIPPDRAAWSRWDQLEDRNQSILRDILEKASVNRPDRSPIEQKIGDFYAACMDEAAIEKKGFAPLKPGLDRIAAMADKRALAEEVARLHRTGADVLFRFVSVPDFKDANVIIAAVVQGGLGLPDRDYYLKDDESSAGARKRYVEHVSKMFTLLGSSPERAAAGAQTVMRIETALAKGSLDNVSLRDPAKLYHMMRRDELATSLTPSFGWAKYLSRMNAPPFERLDVAMPDFFKELNSLIDSTSLEDWKTYLTWHLVHQEVAFLSSGFVNEDFDFFGKFLTGAQELRPRWKRCVASVDNGLGEALGRSYVERTFGAGGKERTLQMVQTLERALGKDIMALDWMSPTTKQKALEKLHAVANKIGYPDKWRDYSIVTIVRGDAVGDDERAAEFDVQRQLNKIGKPVDRTEWRMTPPTVNAYYSPLMNNINFPAGILQPPFFDKNADDAENLGAIGAIIGHELTHGFDDEGRKFDAKGNLQDWWTADDAREFEKRADCVAEEYSSFKAVGDVPINGKLTLGENIADSGGLRLAYMALLENLADRAFPKINGFTPEQRFFLASAQVWCQNSHDEVLRLSAQTDTHSVPQFRVNGVVQNMPEFQKAFGCRMGQAMVRKPACRVW